MFLVGLLKFSAAKQAAPDILTLPRGMELPADLNGCSAAIPAALEEMMTSHNNIGQISQYCKSAYQQVLALHYARAYIPKSGDVTPELYNQTKQYTNDALLNVAYHVHQVSLQLTNYLQVQTAELEKVDLQIRTITDVRLLPEIVTHLSNSV